MKIAYITTIKIPSPQAISEQVLNNLSALNSCRKFDITIIAPKRTEEDCSEQDICRFYGFKEPVHIKTLSYFRWLRPKVRRIIHPFCAPIYCIWKGYDVLYTRHPSILLFCLLLQKRTVFDTYRLDIAAHRKYSIWRMVCLGSRNLIGIFTHSELARRSFIDAGYNPEKIITAYNGCNDGYDTSHNQREKIRAALQILQKQIVICYSGRIESKKKRTDLILHIAEKIPEAVFLIVGGATKKDEDDAFDASIKQLKLTNVIRTGMVKPCEVMDYLCSADILIIPPSGDPLTKCGKTVLPMKTFQYLSARKPILAPRLPDIEEVLHHEENALLADTVNIDDAILKLQRLITDKALREKLSKQCCEDIKKYSWEFRAKQISDFLIK